MTFHLNYLAVNKSGYAVQSDDSRATETTLKAKLTSMVYPCTLYLNKDERS
jgi:hypothetical protein